jgi:hypothetical protein
MIREAFVMAKILYKILIIFTLLFYIFLNVFICGFVICLFFGFEKFWSIFIVCAIIEIALGILLHRILND